MRVRRLFILAVLTATTAAVLGPPGNPAAAGPVGPVASAAEPSRSITLVTGDRVRVKSRPGKPPEIRFEAAKAGRSRGATISRTATGHTMVIPHSVAADVATGKLDRALFDVETLLAERYDDERSKVLPIIVKYAGTAATAKARAIADKPAGAARTRVLASIGARSVAVAKTSGTAFWGSVTTAAKVEPAVESIQLDRRVKASLDRSVPQIGAPAAWQRGFTGKGVKVAVLDTGIDTSHPDLVGKVTAEANFTESPGTSDLLGHGTHVASTIAGSGAAAAGKLRGVAPDAELLNGRVLDEYGFGSVAGIISGMEWATTGQGADVVNLSLGGAPTDGTDLMSEAVNVLSRQTGALFVVAAGNCPGPDPQQVSSPAAADLALAVANLERDGTVAESSCRGPRSRDFAPKPEIAAPGTDIVAARAQGTELGEPVGEHYVKLTGTSMATPHVAGSAALLAQQHPDWTGEQLKARLVSTSDPQGDGQVTDQGAGRVDADQATDGSVSVDTAVVHFGYLKWPHDDQQPIKKQLTYRNSGSTPVTLALAAVPAGPALDSTRLTVPAGGQATVEATVDPGTAYGHHTGRIVATPDGGGDPLVSLYGWYLEDERYEVTITGVNRDGSAPDSTLVIGRPDGAPATGLDPMGIPMVNGRTVVRVPPGTLDISSVFQVPATDDAPDLFSLVAAPQVTVTGDTAVTLDARKAVPTGAEVADRPGLNARERLLTYVRTTEDGTPASVQGAAFTSGPPLLFATPTRPVSIGGLEYAVGGRLEVAPFRATVVGAGSLPVADVSWAPRFTGTRDLTAVDAGRGAPADLADVRGKLAVIQHDPTADWADPVLIAAQEAGAAAVLLYNPAAAGLDGADRQISGEGVTVPTLRTSRVAAARLLALVARRPVTVRITGVAETPFVYDLLHPWNKAIPADARHRARTTELARIDERFHAHEKGMTVQEFRDGSTPLNWMVGFFHELSVQINAPARRTSYLSTGSIRWLQGVLPALGSTQGSSWYDGVPASYRPGERLTTRWFAPVATTTLPDSERSHLRVQRAGDGLTACFSAFDGPGPHFESSPPGDFSMTLRRNGAVLGTLPEHCVYAEVSAESAAYEIELDAKREDQFWKYSTHVHSTWAFRSAGRAEEVMPLVLADLDVPQADPLNRVVVGRPTTVRLALRHQAGSGSTADFTTARLEQSYDGTTWAELPLRAAGNGRYTATVTHPADRAGQAPSLRLVAKDAAGNELRQEVTRAYGLVAR